MIGAQPKKKDMEMLSLLVAVQSDVEFSRRLKEIAAEIVRLEALQAGQRSLQEIENLKARTLDIKQDAIKALIEANDAAEKAKQKALAIVDEAEQILSTARKNAVSIEQQTALNYKESDNLKRTMRETFERNKQAFDARDSELSSRERICAQREGVVTGQEMRWTSIAIKINDLVK